MSDSDSDSDSQSGGDGCQVDKDGFHYLVNCEYASNNIIDEILLQKTAV